MSKLSKTLKSPKYDKYDLIWISSEILISLNYKKINSNGPNLINPA